MSNILDSLRNAFSSLSGKKTYLFAVATVCYAVSAAIIDKISWHEAWQLIWASGVATTLRHGIGARNA